MPIVGKKAFDEFRDEGYMSKCYPTLFPWGAPVEGKHDYGAEINHPRPVSVTIQAYIAHLTMYKDERFANTIDGDLSCLTPPTDGGR
jgi:hypothetical protein